MFIGLRSNFVLHNGNTGAGVTSAHQCYFLKKGRQRIFALGEVSGTGDGNAFAALNAP